MFEVITGEYERVTKELNRLSDKYDYVFIKKCHFDEKYSTLRILVEYFSEEECECEEEYNDTIY